MATTANRMLHQRFLFPSNLGRGAVAEGPTLFQLLFRAYLQDGFTDVALCSTDHRDKIYGLLGLAVDAKKLGFEPDYAKTWQDVYIETSTMLLRHNHALLLVLCQGETEDRGGLPSWVTDWRHPLTECRSIREGVDRPFLACGKKKSPTEWIATQNPKVFSLKGAKVDKIHKTGLAFEAKRDDYLASGFTFLLKFLGEIERYYFDSLALGLNVTPYTQTSGENAR
jgi:hypothetical protein